MASNSVRICHWAASSAMRNFGPTPFRTNIDLLMLADLARKSNWIMRLPLAAGPKQKVRDLSH
jgi:hypothetical protein